MRRYFRIVLLLFFSLAILAGSKIHAHASEIICEDLATKAWATYDAGFSLSSRQVWRKDFEVSWEYFERDPSDGAGKLKILATLGIEKSSQGLKIPTHREFIRNYIDALDHLGVPQEERILPAVVLVRTLDSRKKDFLLITPGIDAWPTDPAFRIYSADEGFNIPAEAVSQALRRGRYPLLEGMHDICHFASFLSSPEYMRAIARRMRQLEPLQFKGLEPQLFYLLESLTLADPKKVDALRRILLVPTMRKSEKSLPLSEYLWLFSYLPIETVLAQAKILIQHYDKFLVDYAGGTFRSAEKESLFQGDFQYSNIRPDLPLVKQSRLAAALAPFFIARRSDNESLLIDSLSTFSGILQGLLRLRELPEEEFLEISKSNRYFSEHFQADGKYENPLVFNYQNKLDAVIRQHLARMEYFAWESANQMTVERWVTDLLKVSGDTDTPLREFIGSALGELSTLTKALVPIDKPRDSDLKEVQRWIKKTKSDSAPSPIDDVETGISDEFVEARPKWAEEIQYNPSDKKNLPLEAMMVPQNKVKEFAALSKYLEEAKTYDAGIEILRTYLIRVGLIQSFRPLVVRHGSSTSRYIILRDGILSAKELEERKISVPMNGQNMGDGVYAVGGKEWGKSMGWGKYQYEIRLPQANIFLGNNSYAAAFVKLYEQFRRKWNLPRYMRDSYMTPGLPENAYSSRGLLKVMPWFYQDMQIDGASDLLAILLKTRKIDPQYIRLIR